MGALITFAVVAAFTVGGGLDGGATENALVPTRDLAEEGWSGIDVQLERQADRPRGQPGRDGEGLHDV